MGAARYDEVAEWYETTLAGDSVIDVSEQQLRLARERGCDVVLGRADAGLSPECVEEPGSREYPTAPALRCR